MNFKYNFEKEPNVMDETLIFNVIISQAPQGDEGKLFKEQRIEYEKVSSIRLDFLDILKIDYLWILTGLVKLQLSNNLIEKIENLETLTNLKELDLSFNNITQIENLDHLRNLQVLTLFANKIKSLENLDNLTWLKVISLGNNRLNDIKDVVVYLRQFKYLMSLNLSGNPFSQQETFQTYVFAYLPNLSYYEYRMVSEGEKVAARQEFRSELAALEEVEAAVRKEEILALRRMEQEGIIKAAFVENIAGDRLFNAMFSNDPEGNALLLMADEISEAYKEYMKNFSLISDDIHECGLQKYATRQQEITQYNRSVEEAKQRCYDESRVEIELFLVKKKEMFDTLQYLIDTDEDDVEAMAELSAKILVTNEMFQDLCLKTWQKLMGKELYLFEAIEKVNQKLELSLTLQINSLVDSVQGSFTQLRILESAYYEATSEISDRYQVRLTVLLTSTKETVVTPELLKIMESKDCLKKGISASHDTHLHVIDEREDELVSSAKSWLRHFLHTLSLSEITRNRKHIAEINHFLNSQKDELNAMLATPSLPNEIQDALQ